MEELMSAKEFVITFVMVLVLATLLPLMFVPVTDWIHYFERPVFEIISSNTAYYVICEFLAFFLLVSWRAIM